MSGKEAARVRAKVKSVAKAAGMTIEVRRFRWTAEVLVNCKPGHCWAGDCHQRVFEADSIADAYAAASKSIDWMAANQEACEDGVCHEWRDGECGWAAGDFADLVADMIDAKHYVEGKHGTR